MSEQFPLGAHTHYAKLANKTQQEEIDAALDKPTFLDCHSTIRSWLEYQHRLGRKAVFYPDKNYADILDENGGFYAFIVRHEYDYFCSL